MFYRGSLERDCPPAGALLKNTATPARIPVRVCTPLPNCRERCTGDLPGNGGGRKSPHVETEALIRRPPGNSAPMVFHGLRPAAFGALGQVATFGTTDKSSYQPWLFVMQAAKNSSLPAKNLPSLR